MNRMITEPNELNQDLSAVRSGDSAAFDRLLAAYRPLLDAQTASFSRTCSADPGEIRAEAEYALYRAAVGFDPLQSATSFGLYAKICVRNRLISRFARRHGAGQSVTVVGLDRLPDSAGVIPPESVGDPLVDAESVQQLCRKIRSVLSAYETSVFFLWVDSYTTAEIAVRLGRDEKSVSNAISRSLSKLRRALS